MAGHNCRLVSPLIYLAIVWKKAAEWKAKGNAALQGTCLVGNVLLNFVTMFVSAAGNTQEAIDAYTKVLFSRLYGIDSS